jgi:hypothetical protein
MDRTPVSSSNIASIGYDQQSMTLEVEFLNGAVYQYYSVPESEHEALMSADSHGKYLDAYIKKGGYSFARVS